MLHPRAVRQREAALRGNLAAVLFFVELCINFFDNYLTDRHVFKLKQRSKKCYFSERLVADLQLKHEGISTLVVEQCIRSLEMRIRQAEQFATQPEDASFSVRFPGK